MEINASQTPFLRLAALHRFGPSAAIFLCVWWYVSFNEFAALALAFPAATTSDGELQG